MMRTVPNLLIIFISLHLVWSKYLSSLPRNPGTARSIGHTNPAKPILERSYFNLKPWADDQSNHFQERDLGPLQITLYNNFGTDVNISVLGYDPNDNPVILQVDGQWYYPPPADSPVPTAVPSGLVSIPVPASDQTTNITLPTDLLAGRLWVTQGDFSYFYVGNDVGKMSIGPPIANPSTIDARYGFIEVTYQTEYGLWVDVSNVDSVELALGLALISGEGPTQRVGGLSADSLQLICDDLQSQALIDGYSWEGLCFRDSQGNILRILSPNSYIQLGPNAFSDYWTSYVDGVWSKYSVEPLTINTQSSELGDAFCQVQSDVLTCYGGNGTNPRNEVIPFSRPSSEDIFSCSSGPFTIPESASDLQKAIVARLCAAFNRATLLLDGGDVQPNGPPSSAYYSGNWTMNWYSKLVHHYESFRRGYAFPYDDVTSDQDISQNESQSGLLFSNTPESLRVFVSELQG